MAETEPTTKGYKEKRKEKRQRKKAKREYEAFLHSSFIKIIIYIYCLALILSLKSEGPFFDLKRFVIAFVIATVVSIAFWYMRRLCLGYKQIFELDMRAVYNFERRKLPFYKNYNYKLLYYTHFFEGDFLKAISVCDESLEHTKSKKYTLLARHTKILSLFFSEGTQNIKELISQQRELKEIVKSADFDFMLRQYQFIESYLDGDYEKAMETVIDFMSDEKESVYNSRKIVFLQFQKMLYLKNNDAEGIENCNAEILKCDSKRKTFFSELTDINIH